MIPMHVIVQAAPQDDLIHQTVALQGVVRQIIDLPSTKVVPPLPRSFEEVLSCLESFARMFIEPDGSFVWVGGESETNWQLDGQLNDGSTGLNSVEIKGTVSTQAWNQLLQAVGWPDAQLLMQLPREGIFMTEMEFRRFAEFC
ncbi:MAG: hypothetical protein GY768_28575 [Planctomycetaceae bacterium]|nr:hypothetical protein [Planctomycetaceae bacterium]